MQQQPMKPAPNQPITMGICIYGGVYCKTWLVPDVGTIVPQHSHNHDHLTLVMSGAVQVWRDGEPVRDYTAPSAVQIPAHSKHLFVTLTDNVALACLHAADTLEDEEPAVAEEHQLVHEGDS